MSIFDKKRLTEEYSEEIRKQTDPYGYFCRNEAVKRGEGHESFNPSFCVIKDLAGLVFPGQGGEGGAPAEGKSHILLTDENSEFELLQIEDDLKNNADADIIYWDEDRILEGKRHAPFFKPDWSPDTLLNCNYIGDTFLIKTELALKAAEAARSDGDGSGPAGLSYNESELRYDFLLRATELAATVKHIPVIVKHIADETASEEEIYAEYTWQNQSQKYIKIRNDALKRRGYGIYYEKVFERKDNSVINNNAINNIVIKSMNSRMSLSVIIPSKDHSDILKACLESIKRNYAYGPDRLLEIIIVDNGSSSAEGLKTEDYLRGYPREIPVKYIYKKMDFNYSVMCNMGAEQAQGEYLLFLNDDIELTDDNTLERMYAYASLEHTGAVGAKLYYPGDTVIQHTGITVDPDCGPTHKLATYSDDKPYYYGRNVFNLNILAVTGACLMVSREKYFKCGGFNDKMSIGYNDVELCVRLYENGYFNIILNECILFHHESLSRGMDHVDDAKYKRLKDERQLLYDLHPWIRQEGDPFYSVNLIPDTLDYSVAVMPEYSVRASRSRLLNDNKLADRVTAMVQSDAGSAAQEEVPGKRKAGNKRVHFNIERTGSFRGIMKDEEDYYQIEGWAILNKRDNALYTTELALISSSGECRIFDTFKRSREDVAVVFVNEKNLFLTGFVCKIPVSLLDKEDTYRIAVIKRSGLTGRKYIGLGDYYEPARGYRAKEG